MASKSTLYRQKVKEQHPEKYEEYLKKQREHMARRTIFERQKWEQESHTRAQVEEHNAKTEAKRVRERERYRKKKLDSSRQTRSSIRSSAETEPKKRSKEMDDEEYRVYRADKRKQQRQHLSIQKKTAIRVKDRERKKLERERKRLERLPAEVNTPEPGTSAAASASTSNSRLRQAVYNLNHEYKQKAKQMNITNEEYARAALNLLNPRTPEKRLAIVINHKSHPCKTLFVEDEVDLDLEAELGIQVADILECGPSTDEPVSKPVHDSVKVFFKV